VILIGQSVKRILWSSASKRSSRGWGVGWGVGAVSILTILWDLSRAPLKEEANAPSPRLNQLDGPGVGHVPGGLPVNLDDLVPDLMTDDQIRGDGNIG